MDYINKNVQGISSYTGVDHSAYGALCKGKATCQGKALLLYRMLRELGVANRILMGVDAAAHTYNIVMIEGKYYYCDPSTTTVVLKGTNSFKPATLQEHYQTAEFKAGVLSKLSASDYPLKPAQSETPAPAPSEKPDEETQKVEYEMLDGADSTYDANTQAFSLRAAGEMEKFVSVEVDGKVVDPKYYTVKEGSTIIIFTKEFMDSLSEGEHVVTFNFTDGVATANIKVAEREIADESVDSTETVEDESTEKPSTDQNNTIGMEDEDSEKKSGISPIVWVLLVLVIVAGAAGGFVWYKKNKEEKSCNI